MKKSRRVLSLVLTAIMLVTSFSISFPYLKLDASAAIDGVTQTQIVTDTSVYNTYAANYLGGASFSTGIVIPGLDPAQDYVIQGMTYYPKRDWMLVTAYHNVADGETVQSSKVFALDATTGNFVAMFSFLNVDGTANTDHGGGIAVSENNIYYSCGDKDRKIAYAPLSALENAPLNSHTQIQLVAEKDFVEIGSVSSSSKTAYSAYVCYDEGILWMGNFYDMGAKLLGATIAAADYNAPSNNTYNSMVFGYKLSGSTSAEEWANLTGAKGTDCQGNPSYSIGLSNNLKDVQYAVVDNGKLYLSRSYGSGAGNSIRFGFGESSFLTIADIDLSQPGTVPVTISTTGTDSLDKTVNAYDISDYKDYAMMPMSEGLCVIGGELFITFEGASNKYLNESSGITAIGNCDKPVDVIWQLDPYDLMNVEVAEPEKSIRYEKINSLADIEDGKEYIIVYESAEVDPVTQENILYAFDAFGNFKDYKLSKSDASEVKGYNGMIGHAITDYDLTEDGVLYLNDPENDDIENVRWTLNNVSGKNYKITNTATYFANCNCFYFDEDQITMAPDNAGYLGNLVITQVNSGDGRFYFYNGDKLLWCNDGTKADYNNKINSYYSNNATYKGLTEQKGTIHCDAFNNYGNVMGQSIPEDGGLYSEGAFYIFRRVVDETSSTYESRVYSGLDAKLQADGTYTVTLETYAISPNHYQYRGVKPTDYIIIADTSGSMGSKDGTGISKYTGDLGVASLSLDTNTSDDNGEGVCGYGFSNPEEDIYVQHTDGKYYKVYLAINNIYKDNKVFGVVIGRSFDRQRYWAYYVADDGLYYVLQDTESGISGTVEGGVWPGITYNEFKYNVDNDINYSDYSAKSNNSDRRKEDVYIGTHYRYDNVSHHPEDQVFTRFQTLKEATKDLIADIATENSENRIALVTYGSGSSYLGKSGWATLGFTDALWNASDKATLQTAIDNVAMSTQTSNDGIEFNCVNEIIANSGADYKGTDSNRNVAVILLTDGVAGADGGSNPTTAANNVISKALTAKNAGAFIYTVMIGADGTTFNRNAYVEAVSSKYAEATSMTDLGGQSVDGINYNLSLATATIGNFVDFGGFALKETSENNGVGLENLDANAYLREQLSDAFMFPAAASEYDVKVELVPGVFDKIGRFTFDEANATESHGVSHVVDTGARTVTVTNYNYSKQYIAKNRKTPGNKLRITIEGLLANPAADLTNTSINNTQTTGIFKTKGNMDSNVAFKFLPTEYFNIPKYTYVLDYGVDMLDTDVNGTLCAVSEGLTRQNVNAYTKVSENGLVAIQSGDQNLLYSAVPSSITDSGYVLINRDDGTYDWFEIEVVPASNVYFEETSVSTIAKEGNTDWTTTGSAVSSGQDLSSDSDVYGYDSSYATGANTFSHGTAYTTTVTSSAKRSDTRAFSYTGTGFDLMSACGPNTGILVVTVRDSANKIIKSYIVDTYINDASTFGADALLKQVPIVHHTNNHGTYKVEVAAAYLSSASALQRSARKGINGTDLTANVADGNTADVKEMLRAVGMGEIAEGEIEAVWFDDNSIFNGGTGATGNVSKKNRAGSGTTSLENYVDGFRVYNPLGNDSEAYVANEKNAQYFNVIDSLSEGAFGQGISSLNGIAYINGTLDDGVSLDYSNYQSVGPQYELYLKPGSAISFKVNGINNSASRVMLSMRAVSNATTCKIGTKDFSINSSTELYYDVTDVCAIDTTNGTATITVTNNGSSMLSLNTIKLTGDAMMAPLSLRDLDGISEDYFSETSPVIVENGVVKEEVEELPDTDVDTDADNGSDTEEGGTTEGADTTLGIIEDFIRMILEAFESIFKFIPLGGVA